MPWDDGTDAMADQQSTDQSGADALKPTPQEFGWVERSAVDYEQAMSKEPLQEDQASMAKYEYNGDFGDIGPAVPELESILFNTKFRVQAGGQLQHLLDFNVVVEGTEMVKRINKFEDAGLHPVMLETIKLCGFDAPTPIQQYSIPAVNHGVDMIAVSQTGSGKTAAYLIPIISRMMGKAKKWAAPRPNPTSYNPQIDATRAEPLVLIICPTRELAMQIFDDARRFCYRSMLRPCVVYGGAPRRQQLADLQRGCDILIATPGRLKDFIENDSHWLSLARCKYTILDEADAIIQPDWEEQMKSILAGPSANQSDDHHFMMFSATFNKESRAMARQYLQDDYLKIKVGRVGSVHKNVVQDIIWVNDDQKTQALLDLLNSMPPCRTLVFCNANGKCDTIDDFLYQQKFPVTSIHSGRTQYEREDAIRAFRTGKCPIMVTSDVAARGLDVRNVMHIINYDLPSTQHGGIEEYVHRIGRTARIGNLGQATSFYNERNEDLAPLIVNILIEGGQTVPDFLTQYVDESGVAVFEADVSDEEGDETNGGDAGVDGWGDAAPASADVGGDAWGAAAPAVSSNVQEMAW